MVGGIKFISPGMKSTSADMFLDLPTMWHVGAEL